VIARQSARPLRLGPVELRNRIVAAPMERNYCDTAGRPTDHYLRHLAALARGGSALVYAEASFVRADGRARPHQLAADEDAASGPLGRLADAVHREGALFGMQLVHGGRLARASVSGFVPVAPSPVVAEVIGGDLPTELDHADIADLVDRFGAAAHRCVRAGADVISIHAAHGYLISQFLSPRTNLRGDEYGEPAHFLREVIAAVRAGASDAAVGIRVSAYEGVPGGLDIERTLSILTEAGAAELDFVDVSAGCYEAGQWITPTGELPRGLHAEAARRFRALGPPVGVAGRISDAPTAEQIMTAGHADFVTVGRALHADPEWPLKVLQGRRPRPCIACNYCADGLRTGEPVGCTVNPEVHAPIRRRRPTPGAPQAVLIVGAGPAGLEAARRTAMAGRRTRLVDRGDRLGGTFALAARLHPYPEYQRIIDWYAAQLDDLGVTVELGTDLSPEDIAVQPENAIVVATGAPGSVPDVPGADLPRVRALTAWLREGLERPLEPRYLVWGADRDGTAVADHLAANGARVVLIGSQAEPAEDVGGRAKLLELARLRTNPRVELVMGATVERINDDGLRVRDPRGGREIAGAAPILVSMGRDGAASIAADIAAAAPAKSVITVGDAAGQGGWTAIAIRHAATAVESFANGALV
jgi:2,4-dienoyl-CoA reductase-like NADH-dependent reductase (Old Yellow Enzyme family)/thioredoxin reductase